MINWLRISWLLACLITMVWAIADCGNVPADVLRGECFLVAGIVVLALGFPASAGWWLIVAAVGHVFSSSGIELGLTPVLDAMMWFGSVVVGYMQWFVLLPWLMRRFGPRSEGT